MGTRVHLNAEKAMNPLTGVGNNITRKTDFYCLKERELSPEHASVCNMVLLGVRALPLKYNRSRSRQAAMIGIILERASRPRSSGWLSR